MAELVEHSADVVGSEQCGLARRRRSKVGDVVDNRRSAHQLGLADEAVHPGATLLVVALEVVAVEQRQVTAVGIEYFEDAHALGVGRNVFALLEGDSIQLGGSVEDAVLQHVVQLEVRLDLLFIEIVLRLAHLLGVNVPIPRLRP